MAFDVFSYSAGKIAGEKEELTLNITDNGVYTPDVGQVYGQVTADVHHLWRHSITVNYSNSQWTYGSFKFELVTDSPTPLTKSTLNKTLCALGTDAKYYCTTSSLVIQDKTSPVAIYVKAYNLSPTNSSVYVGYCQNNDLSTVSEFTAKYAANGTSVSDTVTQIY